MKFFPKQKNPFAAQPRPFVIMDVQAWLMDRAENGPRALIAFMALTVALREKPQRFWNQ